MPGSYCSVRDCTNGRRGLVKWMELFCPIHECNKGTSRCICEPPFVLYPFPTERRNPERREEWIKCMNRKSTTTGQNWIPSKNSRVCSDHFVKGAPSRSFPNPTLSLGYPLPSISKGKKRPQPNQRRPDTVQALKKQKLDYQSDYDLSTEDTQNEGPIKEDTTTTCESNPGHVDHTYASTIKCNCVSDCNCDTIAKLSSKIVVLENKLNMSGVHGGTSLANMMNITMNDNADNKRYFTDRFISDNRSVKLNTGLPDQGTFNKLLEFLIPRVEKVRYWSGTQRVVSTKGRKFVRPPQSRPGRKLSIKSEFLMVLMKLRLGLTNEFLASMFSINVSSCSIILTTWIKFLGVQLRGLVFWPDKSSIRSMLPASLAVNYPDLRCLLDWGETLIDRPKDLKLHAATWSVCKKHNTLKYLVGIAPNGHISFLSKAWGGCTTDREIVQQSGFLDLVEPQDIIMADRDFPIQEDLHYRMATLVIPPPISGLEQMCSQNVARIKQAENVRIHVERAVNRLKWFKILSTTLPVTMVHFFDDVLTICAALCNLLPPLTV